MEFFAKSYQLSTILTKREYEIPEFQREYAWESEQLEEFWEDINSTDAGQFFLGTIVLAGKNFTDEIGPFKIIDGQQRITTVLLLINRMIKRLEELKEKSLSVALRERLIFKDDDAKEHLVLKNDNAHSYFQKIVFYNIDCRENNVEVKNLLMAKKYFEDKIKNYSLEDLKKLRNILLSINFIVVVQENTESAINIFETLNFRGIDLNILDLVKSFVVRKYPKKIGIDDPREKWKIFLNNIKEDKKNFFNRYWASYFKKVSDIKIYKEFNKETRNYQEKDVEFFLNSLIEFSEIYKDVISPSDSDWDKYCPHDIKLSDKIKSSVLSLLKIKVRVHYSFLITILWLSKNKNIHQDDLKSLLNVMEKFHFVFNAICSRRPSGMDYEYSKYAVDLRKDFNKINEISSNLITNFKTKIPSKEEFVALFKQLSFDKDKGKILYIFRCLEKKMNPGLEVDITEESLDHLSTQSKKEVWCHNVGNLILLEKELNNERDDLDLHESIEIIKRSSYKSTLKFIEKVPKAWTEQEVEKRASSLAEVFYDDIIKDIF